MTDIITSPASPEAVPADARFQQAVDIVARLKAEIGRAVVGQDAVVEQVLVALLAGGHVLLEGVPGLGKTLLVKALAKTFAGHFARIQFTPDLLPADVMGHAVYDMNSQTFNLRRGPVFTNLLLADEINRAPAKTQSALLEVMQERQVTIEGESHTLTAPFMTLATQNPIEQEGTYPLPEAQLDRFLLKVLIEYPSLEQEVRLVRQVTQGKASNELDVAEVQTVIKPETVLALQKIVSGLRMDDQVLDYVVRIVRATREWPGISIGAGPRGGIALARAARATALVNGRSFVTPDDVKSIAVAALRHRISAAPEVEIEGYTTDTLLQALLNQVPAPRQ